jgi:hypothetical protein
MRWATRWGIFAFSGESAENVAVLRVKAFDERRSLGGRTSHRGARC